MGDYLGELDEFGQWTGTCAECGTNHDGYPPDTLGGQTRCLRAQAENLGASHLVDQVEAFHRDQAARTAKRLRDTGLIESFVCPHKLTYIDERCPRCDP